MIRLKTLSVVNLFQYHKATIEFQPGVNILLGPNGSGKTNLLNCISFALTGTLVHKKTDCVNYHSDGKSVSVELQLTANGANLVLFRSLKEHILFLNNEKIVGAQEIENVLEAVLGVSPSVFSKYIFLNNTSLRGLIERSPKERLSFLQTFLPIDKFSRLWQEIGDVYNTKATEAAADYTKECNRYKSLAVQLQQYDPDILSLSSDEVSKQLAALEQLNYLLNQERKINEKLQELTGEKEKILAKIAESTAAFQPNPILDKYVGSLSTVTNAESAKSGALSAFSSRPKAAKFISEKKIENASIRLHSIKSRIEQISGWLQQLNQDTCFVCHSKIDSQNIRKKYEDELIVLRREFLDTQRSLAQLKDLRMKYDEIKKKRSEIRQKLRLAINLRDAIGVKGVHIDLAELTEYAKRKKTYELGAKNNELRERLFVIKGQIEALEAQKNELYKTRQTVEFPESLSKEYLNRKLHLVKEVEQLKMQMEALKPFLEKQQHIDELRKKLDILSLVREVFHPNGAPRILTQSFISLLNSVINTYLDFFQTNFSVTITDSGEISVLYKSGAILSEKQLSFGEQLMLSISIFLAIAEIITPLNLLILDEPTLGLDEDHVSRLPAIIQKLAMKGQQIVCATHEKALILNAENVIMIEDYVSS